MTQPCHHCGNKSFYFEATGEDTYCSYQCQCIQRTEELDNHMTLMIGASKKDYQQKSKTFGPESRETFALSEPVRKFVQSCTKYVASLPLFSRYLVWRYSIGSASVNTFLILGDIKNLPFSIHWCYLFCLYWKNTVDLTSGDDKPVVPSEWKSFQRFLKEPGDWKILNEKDALPLVKDFLRLYADQLQLLILGCPPVKKGFHVYKVAGDYPGLPESKKDLPKRVLQQPFNSTTLTPQFNFALFTPPESKGNLFHIHLPKGSRVLYVPSEYHAYPFEQEIILPFGSVFTIYGSYKGRLNVIDPESVDMIYLQDIKKIAMGPVHDMRPYKPCKDGECQVESKKFRIYSTRFTNS